MNKLKWWLLKKLIASEIYQDHQHGIRITQLYQIIHTSAREVFREDTIPGLRSYLQERFEQTTDE